MSARKAPSVSIVLEKRQPKANNYYPVKIRITYQGKTRYYGISKHKMNERLSDLDFQDFQYDGREDFAMKKTDYEKAKNAMRDGIYKRLWQVLNEEAQEVDQFISRMEVFNFSAFKEKYFQGENKQDDNPENIVQAFEMHIDELQKSDRIRTAAGYSACLNSLIEFRGKRVISFYEITPQFLRRFQSWHLNRYVKNDPSSRKQLTNKYAPVKPKLNSPATFTVYAKYIRAIFNEYGKSLPGLEYPFGEKKFKIIAQKRNSYVALNEKEVKKLVNYKTVSEIERYYLDIWLLHFYLCGCNSKDLLSLKYRDIKDGFITFYRAKTHNSSSEPEPVKIVYSKQIKEIIDRIGNKDKAEYNYVLPVFNDTKNEKERIRKLSTTTKTTGNYTQRIADKMGIKKPVTVMTARHSWASIADKKGVPVSYIKKQLSHADLKTTIHYLGQFDDDEHTEIQNMITNLI